MRAASVRQCTGLGLIAERSNKDKVVEPYRSH